jgi:hypothetical protein
VFISGANAETAGENSVRGPLAQFMTLTRGLEIWPIHEGTVMAKTWTRRAHRLRRLSTLSFCVCAAFVIAEFVLVTFRLHAVSTVGSSLVIFALVATGGILRGRADVANDGDQSAEGSGNADDHSDQS